MVLNSQQVILIQQRDKPRAFVQDDFPEKENCCDLSFDILSDRFKHDLNYADAYLQLFMSYMIPD